MNFFRIKTRWTNGEFIPLKLSIAAAYLLIGTYFSDFFRDYYLPVFIVFFITMFWSVYLWINKMKTEMNHKQK